MPLNLLVLGQCATCGSWWTDLCRTQSANVLTPLTFIFGKEQAFQHTLYLILTGSNTNFGFKFRHLAANVKDKARPVTCCEGPEVNV
jgi:hypothetical protein